MKTYICTAGTSISAGGGLKDHKSLTLEHLAKIPHSVWDSPEVEEHREVVSAFVMEKLRAFGPEDYSRVSAEVNSLTRMGLAAEDQVVLIATETVEGQLCADLVRTFLLQRGLCAGAEVKVIKGLQAQDGKRFRREGVKNLLSFLFQPRFVDQKVVLNPTGGLKGVVPYLTLFAMLYRKPVCYIHEFSTDLITLSPLPLRFDEALVYDIEDKLLRIEHNSAISRAEWQTGLPADETLDAFVEVEDGEVTLSGLGFLVWERYKQIYPPGLVRDTTPPGRKPLHLPQTDTPSERKANKLDGQKLMHHGHAQLLKTAERLLKSPYVKSIPNSCEYQPRSTDWVKPLSPREATRYMQIECDNICRVTLVNTDVGYAFLIETTALDPQQNRQIAEALERKFFR